MLKGVMKSCGLISLYEKIAKNGKTLNIIMKFWGSENEVNSIILLQ